MSEIEHAKPSAKQLAWQDLEFGMFCHFGPNTFLDQEWGDGTADPAVFNPMELDPHQWARVAREAGMRYLVFTAKHHDGFCNWPTDTTEYSVKASPLAGGKADVVAMAAEAARAEGLKFGLYCSPWDRHEPSYADSAAYDDLYIRQWTELLTRYGPLVCIWLDGAGSEGHVYDWERIIGTMRELQPDAAIFSIGEPDYRWAGNEDGLAPDPCWNEETRPAEWAPAFLTKRYLATYPHWVPAECDARIRANWFWNSYDLPSLKSTERLCDIYERSVGHGANLLLNVGPDNQGLLPQTDVARLLHMGDELRKRYGAPVGEAEGPAARLEVRFDRPKVVSGAICCEDISDGEKVREYVIHVLANDRWEGMYVGTAMGHKKIDKFPKIAADAVAVSATKADGEAVLKSLQVF
jgi:alpha-L-fucosidase